MYVMFERNDDWSTQEVCADRVQWSSFYKDVSGCQRVCSNIDRREGRCVNLLFPLLILMVHCIAGCMTKSCRSVQYAELPDHLGQYCTIIIIYPKPTGDALLCSQVMRDNGRRRRRRQNHQTHADQKTKLINI